MAKGKTKVTLVGAGNLGRALALRLPKAGYPIEQIVSRSPSKAAALAKKVGTRAVRPWGINIQTDVVWLAVGDSAIRACAEALAKHGTWKGRIVLHSSGALSSDELDALRKKGAFVASAHPMMTFVADSEPQLKGIAWTVEGDPTAVALAKRIISGLGGSAYEIRRQDKVFYHVFGAFLSPLLVVHLDAAAEVASKAGIKREQVTRFMEPIIHRTLQNLYAHLREKDGPGKAFSGPLVRGDVGTIERHLKTLQAKTRAGRLYRALIEAALESDLPIKERSRIRRLLRSVR